MTNQPKNKWSEKTTLIGHKLRLEPLDIVHLNDLEKNLLSPTTWHFVHWGLKTRDDLEQGIKNSHVERENLNGNAFCMIVNSTNEAIGMSRLMTFDKKYNHLEVGGTWIGDKYQRTYVNTEAKYLMLKYVFENLGCNRVSFKADSLNFKSQNAILRLGAKFEGELRNYCVLPDGRIRDYKIYSIISNEWPNLKKTLEWTQTKYV